MKGLLAAIACGLLLFGSGLVVSDMVNPARVLAFFDVGGAWDPSLALVMAGALVPSALAYAVRRRMTAPVLDTRFAVPAAAAVDRRLLGGAVLFGMGWGLVGLCPGPALAALTSGAWQVLVFVLAMLAGMVLFRLVPARSRARIRPGGPDGSSQAR